MKFIELYLTKNKNILLIGEGTCGKSNFMTYIKEVRDKLVKLTESDPAKYTSVLL